jgi:hypothetical protein
LTLDTPSMRCCRGSVLCLIEETMHGSFPVNHSNWTPKSCLCLSTPNIYRLLVMFIMHMMAPNHGLWKMESIPLV